MPIHIKSGRSIVEPDTGNLWGLQERIVAVRSLCALAQELRSVRRPLQELLTKSQAAAVETFYSRTVEASGESYPQHWSRVREDMAPSQKEQKRGGGVAERWLHGPVTCVAVLLHPHRWYSGV